MDLLAEWREEEKKKSKTLAYKESLTELSRSKENYRIYSDTIG